MSTITVEIAGRRYTIACDDGQEAHVQMLAHRLDTRASRLDAQFAGQAPENLLLVMTCLTLADELDRTERLGSSPAPATHQASDSARVKALEANFTAALNNIAERIEKIADDMERA